MLVIRGELSTGVTYFTDTTGIPVSCLFLIDNLLNTLWKIELGVLYLITNQENKAFDLKSDEKRGGEEIKGAAQERIPPHVLRAPACSRVLGFCLQVLDLLSSGLLKNFLENSIGCLAVHKLVLGFCWVTVGPVT